MKNTLCAASDNISWLRQKAELIEGLDRTAYCEKPCRIQADAVGAHVRHILDHYLCLIKGLPAGSVDYDLRQRDQRIVEDQAYAVAKIQDVIRELEKISFEDLERPVRVKMDCGGRSEWQASSVGRELQFLVSHHIHHNALIRMILEAEGVNFSGDFGVAPSTIKHLQKQA